MFGVPVTQAGVHCYDDSPAAYLKFATGVHHVECNKDGVFMVWIQCQHAQTVP